MNTDCITATTIVAVDPAAAFDIFTGEIAAWWRPKVRGLFRPGSQGTLKFENGRLIEVYVEGPPSVVGSVLAWEPGRRVVLEWRQHDFAPGEKTEVEVRFEAIARGTRVTIEHRGWDSLPANHPARHSYTGNAFAGMIGLRWGEALTTFRAAVTRAH
jgi:uncharacterized protein YndB with AHSA1/START domain